MNHKAVFNRKAIFITLSSIMIVSLFILYFSTTESLSVKDKSEIAESRVSRVNNYVENFEEIYLPRALFATANLAITGVTDYMIDQAKDSLPHYINLSMNFYQLMVNGTICDPVVDVFLCNGIANTTIDSMTDHTLIKSLNDLTEISREEMNIIAEFNVTKLILSQTGPWTLNVTAFVEYTIVSPGVVEVQRKNTPISTQLNLIGFRDPFIAVETGGTIDRVINRSNIDPGQLDQVASIQQLIDTGSYVFQNKTAPSFLMRFERNLNASDCCGIESIVSQEIIEYTDDLGKDIMHKSFADYQFLSDVPGGLCRKSFPPDYDPFDELYNRTGITTVDYPYKMDEFHSNTLYGRSRTTVEECQ